MLTGTWSPGNPLLLYSPMSLFPKKVRYIKSVSYII